MKIVDNRSIPLTGVRPRLLRIVKLTIIFLTITVLQVSANGNTQGITVSRKNLSLEEALEIINKQTGYLYFANHAILQKAKRFDLHVVNASLTQVLAICFTNQPLTYTIKDSVILIKEKFDSTSKEFPLLEQGESLIAVKGRVLSEKGEPVAGVSVAVKGTKTSTVTDANGEFSLATIESDAVLIFTHISMETFELKVSGKKELVVNLKTKITSLGDVQIIANTGYQEIAPNRSTGSYATVNNKLLNQQVGTNILKRLEGVTTAVLFDNKQIESQKKSNITIRGLSSINGPMDPLIILDGFIYEGDIDNINPNIVDNISILKDAAAASIWGARAGNGVIVITTKKGNYNQKIQISANANIIFNSKPDLFYFRQMASSDYIDVEQMLYQQGVFDQYFNDPNQLPVSPAVEIFRSRSLGMISASDSTSRINHLKGIDIRNEFNKYFYTNAVNQQYSINLRGGGLTNSYILSLGYDKGRSEVYDKSRRINVHFANSFKPIKRVEATIAVYYANSKRSSGRPAYNSIKIGGRNVPYLQFADAGDNPLAVALSLREGFADTAGGGKLLNWKYFPLEDYKHNITSTDLSEVNANAGVKYELLPSVNAEIRYQYQRQSVEANQLWDSQSFEARNLINLFSLIDHASGGVVRAIPIGGVYRRNFNFVESQTIRGQVNFDKSLNLHRVTGIIGSEIRKAVNSGHSFTTYGYNADPLTNGIVDYVNRYQTFIDGSTRSIPGAPQNLPKLVNKFISFYANFSYAFKERYIVSLSGRKDGSNVFGANTNDKWKPLWSAGVAWELSKEDFFFNKLISLLRLRTTYGYSGNVDLSKTAVPVAGYMPFNHQLTNLRFGSIATLNNPDLRWERIRTINFALDFAIKNGIVRGSVDYYLKRSIDLYGPAPFDYTTWGDAATIIKNVAGLKGSGVELTLHTQNIDRGIKWNTTFLFTLQRNRTSEYFSDEANQITELIGSGNRITPVVGKPLYALAAYKWGGLDDQGNPQGYIDGQKSIDYIAILNEADTKGAEGNVVYIGSALPTQFGSLINTISYKKITVSANIFFKLGYYFRKQSISYSDLIQRGNGHKDFERRWKKLGDENFTEVPAFVYPNVSGRDAFFSYSEINVLKADHIRLHYVNVSYTFEGRERNSAFKNCEIYFNASNLGIIWRKNKHQLDPDYPDNIPPAKTWALGLKADF